MGSRLRNKATGSISWDPSPGWLFKNTSGQDGATRKALLVGSRFNPDYLEVATEGGADPEDTSVGDGFSGIMKDYITQFLTPLKSHDWGALRQTFDLPVYAAGYNWTDDARNAGEMVAKRIQAIIKEAKGKYGMCKKVIVISHSMGGLVSRSASELAGGQGMILGIIHGVQPASGAPAAYWRMKGGFEYPSFTSPLKAVAGWVASRFLGSDATQVTPVLGNIPGGLELLPNKSHRTNAGASAWLSVTNGGQSIESLPQSDPYEEIYRHKAVVNPPKGGQPSTNEYWGLVDPNLLDPGTNPAGAGNAYDQMDAQSSSDAWSDYLNVLGMAESFHDDIGKKTHPHTFCVHGTGYTTADVVELQVESNWVRSDNYPSHGFRGFYNDAGGKSMQAVLQQPSGGGDGTVPVSSASWLDSDGKPDPGDQAVSCEHQPAYANADVQNFAFEAIETLCKQRLKERRGGN
jgi:hypothetical protein